MFKLKETVKSLVFFLIWQAKSAGATAQNYAQQAASKAREGKDVEGISFVYLCFVLFIVADDVASSAKSK